MREALYGLDYIAGEMGHDWKERSVEATMEAEMLADPGYWAAYYSGEPDHERVLWHFSYSDRILLPLVVLDGERRGTTSFQPFRRDRHTGGTREPVPPGALPTRLQRGAPPRTEGHGGRTRAGRPAPLHRSLPATTGNSR